MDSYVSVKINEALYGMKERLQTVEEQFKKVSKEKQKMERILREKVQMIRVILTCIIHNGYSFCFNLICRN